MHKNRRFPLWGCALLLPAVIAGCGSSGKTTLTAGPIASSSPVTGTVNLQPAQSRPQVTLSGTSYDFGDTLAGNNLSGTVVQITNNGNSAITLQPSLPANSLFHLASGTTCGIRLPAGASCGVDVSYTPTQPSSSGEDAAALNLNFRGVPAGTPSTVALTGHAFMLSAGTVSATINPQVALYTITPPFAGNVTVNFGPTTSYGRQTWSVPTPSGGGPVNILVAGMLANTTYHMQATVTFENGQTATDVDHTFAVGQMPEVGGSTAHAPFNPGLTANTPTGETPQPGVELISAVAGPSQGLYATDLAGNVIWTYPFTDQVANSGINAGKLLPNGDIVMDIGVSSEAPLYGPTASNLLIAIREVDLMGKIVRQTTLAQVNAGLAQAGIPITLVDFHHDIEPLPNGHLLVMANTLKQFTNLPGYPGTISVLGDVVVDLDQNWNPVWAWNEFDHLDVNRHPMQFPDWTHSNAIIYSPDDGNFIVSVRHQNWLIKVNYANGSGDGSILWKLGQGGDFTLQGGSDPIDWFYAQHGPSFIGSPTAGIFKLTLMDNGDDRMFPPGVTCGTTGAPACLYSTVPVLQINETAKTATLLFHQIIPPNLYNSFGGNSEQLPNGNIEYDLCGTYPGGVLSSDVFEVTQNDQANTVWHMHSTGTGLYRAFRMPSLYPGVQWTQ